MDGGRDKLVALPDSGELEDGLGHGARKTPGPEGLWKRSKHSGSQKRGA